MSSRGVFFQEMYWFHIPLYFLHFGSRPFNLLIFLMKVLKLFWGKTFSKWKWLCIWLKTKLGNYIFLLLKFCVRATVPTWLTWLFVSIFIKKLWNTSFYFFGMKSLAIFSSILTFLLNLNNHFDIIYFSL